jgi:hypothetical protein
MTVAWRSETSVSCYITTRCRNPKDHHLNLHRREKSEVSEAQILCYSGFILRYSGAERDVFQRMCVTCILKLPLIHHRYLDWGGGEKLEKTT